MSDRGISFDFESTHFYQSLVSGTGDSGFEYGGRLDLLTDFDTGKLGLWERGLIRTHAEYYYGDLSSNLGGALLATNIGVRLPNGGPRDLELTSLHVVQRINDRMTLIAGKISLVDTLAGDPLFGGIGSKRFMNTAFAAPPSGGWPPVMMGGILSLATAPVSWTFMLYDPNDRTEDYWIDGLFDDGVSVSATGAYRRPIAGRASSFTVTAMYSTKDGANLDELLLPPNLQTGTKDGSWHASLQFTHVLREEAAGQLGFYAKIGVSDGNPNPFQTFLAGGIAGTAPFAARPNDSFGIGLFYYDFSDDLQSAVDALVEFDDETGIEVFCTFALKPWIALSADLQFVDPAIGDSDDIVAAGLRTTIRF